MITEKCVTCDVDTRVAVNRNVEFRPFYVIGVGQLCRDCYLKTVKSIMVCGYCGEDTSNEDPSMLYAQDHIDCTLEVLRRTNRIKPL